MPKDSTQWFKQAWEHVINAGIIHKMKNNIELTESQVKWMEHKIAEANG